MSQYEVKGIDQSGRNVKMIIEGDSIKTARTKARAQGITPTSVESVDGSSRNSTAASSSGSMTRGFSNPFGAVSTTDLANMTRQLASLIKAHVPIIESLTAMVDQIDSTKLKKILLTVRQQVNEGKSLADGFALFPQVFDRVYVNMVRAGESSGRLDTVLLRLADFSENRVKLKNKVVGALTYPIIMVVIASLVMALILVKVIPAITGIFIDMGQELPTPTKILIFISDFLQSYIWIIVFSILATALLIERYIKTESGAYKKDRLLLDVPILGRLFKSISVARFARTLGTLLAAGVPMLPSLEVTRNVVSNKIFEDIISNTSNMVSEGRSVAYSVKQSGEFPPIVVHMIGVGEKTGELENMLLNVAENYELQIETILDRLTGLLEPLLMIVMAVVVGSIVISVLLPIFEMNQFGG